MITFPGAQEDGNDVGVAFFPADGIYDRGGRRDNPAEAEFVRLHNATTRSASRSQSLVTPAFK
ncbi:hypothetical protein [Streptomyces sp. C10-9-1]|uniref:hypothetical protein n=1 Tax=Streptomyces sp. C10-9-1 TaxID=1859285 RepID=UPI003D74C5A4